MVSESPVAVPVPRDTAGRCGPRTQCAVGWRAREVVRPANELLHSHVSVVGATATTRIILPRQCSRKELQACANTLHDIYSAPCST